MWFFEPLSFLCLSKQNCAANSQTPVDAVSWEKIHAHGCLLRVRCFGLCETFLRNFLFSKLSRHRWACHCWCPSMTYRNFDLTNQSATRKYLWDLKYHSGLMHNANIGLIQFSGICIYVVLCKHKNKAVVRAHYLMAERRCNHAMDSIW